MRLATALEVREHAVLAGAVERDRHAPGALRVHLRMQVTEAGQVAAYDDQVHAPVVGDVEVRDGLAARLLHTEGERLARPRRAGGVQERDSEPVRARAVRRRATLVGRLLGARADVGVDRAAREQGDGEDQAEQSGEERDPHLDPTLADTP